PIFSTRDAAISRSPEPLPAPKKKDRTRQRPAPSAQAPEPALARLVLDEFRGRRMQSIDNGTGTTMPWLSAKQSGPYAPLPGRRGAYRGYLHAAPSAWRSSAVPPEARADALVEVSSLPKIWRSRREHGAGDSGDSVGGIGNSALAAF